jgi:hypothetical protein
VPLPAGPHLPPLSVERMVRIDRKAVVIDDVVIAAPVDGPDPLVATPAERAQRPEHKGVVIASMRRVVIGDRRRRDTVPLETESAQGLSSELVVSALSPALQAVPIPPGERLRRVGDRSGYDVKGSRLG